MAGTYGEPGKNQYTIPGVGGLLSNVVNADTGITQIYRSGAFGQFPSLGTYDSQTKQFTPLESANLTDIEKIAFDENTKIIKDASIKTSINAGLDPIKSSTLLDENKETLEQSDVQSGSTPTNDDGNGYSTTSSSGSGGGYLKYPADLSLAQQDVIQFTAVEYVASGIGGEGLASRSSGSRSQKGVAVLPISGPISDVNSVDWSPGSLDAISKDALGLAKDAILGGDKESFGKNFESKVKKYAEGENRDTVIAMMAEKILGIQNLQGRTGAILNPNVELLFTSPQLRPFSFNFKLIARNSADATQIKGIINFFKKNMAPIKQDGNAFLKAPNTFLIKYLKGGEEHDGLNQIKECALLSCQTSYTPLGTYMTYEDGTMVEYNLGLMFSELEPVYDTDYQSSGSIGY